MLSDPEKDFLLKVARSSLEHAVRQNPPTEVTTSFAALLEPRGAFVTLRIGEYLRGCIGYVDPVHPLLQTIQEVAAKAALEDTRFPPVRREELEHIWIEISILSPPSRISAPSEIEIGRDGLLLEVGKRRGLLLPQVALEHQWDRETFLAQTARKAGLASEDWRDEGAIVSTFTADIFSERTFDSRNPPGGTLQH